MEIRIVVFFSILSLFSAQLLISNSGPCACNLTPNKCDNDCCCDTDCTDTQKQLFTCTNSLISPNSYGCFPSELLFQNNTAFLNASVDNLYCVYNDNYTLRNFYVPPSILSASDVNSFAATGSMPSLNTVFDIASLFSSSFYGMGGTIYTVVKNSSVGLLGLSRSGIDGACVDGLAVGYLMNELVNCTRVITNITQDCSNLPGTGFYYLPGMVVPATPLIMNTTFTAENFAAVICVGCNAPTTPALTSGICNDVVTQVKYEIYGELNISSVVMTLTKASVYTTFRQQFNVTFIKTQYSSNGTAMSGSPGYVVGYPVLSTNSNGVIQSLNMRNGGDCGTGSSTSVLFGMNSFSDCSVNISQFNKSCQNINNNINNSLSPYFASFLVPYGDLSQVNLVSRIQNDDAYNSAASNPCMVISKLTIYIIYARTGTLTLPQNKIIGYQTSYSYSNLSTNIQSYWVSVSVKFVDNSVILFDLDGLVARQQAQNTVKDFLYLLYVDNGAQYSALMNKTYLLLLLFIQLYSVL